VSTRAVIVQDTLSPINGFTNSDFTAIANEFDTLIYPTDVNFFGAPSDIDTSDRVMILYTPRVNSLTPRGSTGIVGGFFFGGDLFPTAACTQSNNAELFYLLAPDPTGTFNNVRTVTTVRQTTRGTIAHEFQHMINQSIRTAANASPETVWLNEGLSHFAEDAVGRVARGFAQNRNLTDADAKTNINDYNAFFFQNLARFRLWMQVPDTSSPTSLHAASELSHRGAAQMLIRWAADQFGGTDIPAFTRRLVAGPATGVNNLTTTTAQPFDTLVVGWLTANFADDFVTGINARYTYKSWNLRDVETAVNGGSYPLFVEPLFTVGTFSETVRSGSGAYFRHTGAGGSPTRVFRMLDPGTTTTGASFAGARLIVLRIK
jgi:hypothetical protein